MEYVRGFSGIDKVAGTLEKGPGNLGEGFWDVNSSLTDEKDLTARGS